MLFTKEYLSKQVENTYMEESHRQHPFPRENKHPDDKVPFDLIIANKFQYFDQKSTETKDLLYKIRKNISKNCFNSSLNTTFPNQGKIEECIRVNEEEYKKLEYLRETHFQNIFHKYKTDLENCPTYNNDCIRKAEETYVWNAAKLPYFYAENY